MPPEINGRIENRTIDITCESNRGAYGSGLRTICHIRNVDSNVRRKLKTRRPTVQHKLDNESRLSTLSSQVRPRR